MDLRADILVSEGGRKEGFIPGEYFKAEYDRVLSEGMKHLLLPPF